VEMRGPTRCRVVLHNGFAADLWALPERHWGSLLHHVTGNKYHDIRLRDLALARRASLSEYGFTVGDQLVPCATEEEVYAFLGLQYVPPTMRENTGEIDRVNAELAPFRVLQGVEVEVRGDGSLDLADDALAALDLVVAAVHSGLQQEGEKLTARAAAALRHPLVDILAHPTGRILGGRAGGDVDMETLY